MSLSTVWVLEKSWSTKNEQSEYFVVQHFSSMFQMFNDTGWHELRTVRRDCSWYKWNDSEREREEKSRITKSTFTWVVSVCLWSVTVCKLTTMECYICYATWWYTIYTKQLIKLNIWLHSMSFGIFVVCIFTVWHLTWYYSLNNWKFRQNNLEYFVQAAGFYWQVNEKYFVDNW